MDIPLVRGDCGEIDPQPSQNRQVSLPGFGRTIRAVHIRRTRRTMVSRHLGQRVLPPQTVSNGHTGIPQDLVSHISLTIIDFLSPL